MESSAPKRRKTSPSSSVPVESTTPPDPPPEERAQQSQQPDASPSRSPAGLSFDVASPTQSSLAGTNPEIPHRRRATAPRSAEDLPASRPTSPDPDVDTGLDNTAVTASAATEARSESDGADSSPPPPGASQSTQLTAGDTGDAPPRSLGRRVGGRTLAAQPPRRSPTRPQARPLPPPGPEEEEDIAAPFAGRALPRSPFNTGVIPAVVHEEPDLPPTPERPDPVVSTPPSGIHNTPSKRRRDAIERQQRASSPSKQQKQQQQHPLSKEVEPDRLPRKEGQRARGRPRNEGGPVNTAVAEASPVSEQAETGQEAKPNSEFVPGTHPRRSVRLRGPEWNKKDERDKLLREVKQLEADLELARSENNNAASGLPMAADQEDVLDLLRRHLVPAGKQLEPDLDAQWVEMAMNPIALLGFSGAATLDLPPAVPQSDAKDEDAPPTSHHPVPMTASEELPYLQVFTPFNYTSKIATISAPAEQPEQPTLQKHTITIRSATPPGLFSARLEMVVNTRSLAVSSLTVSRLDPAASAELQPFLDTATSSDAPNYHPSLTRNVSIVSWAMAEWYRVALKRARFWHALDTQLGPDAGKAGLVEVVLAMRALKKRRRTRQKEQASGAAAAAEEESSLEAMQFSKKDVLPHMGRTSMDLAIPRLAAEAGGGGEGVVSDLRVDWRVEFDWAGEARSRLGVEVGVPGKCKCYGSLSRVPILFLQVMFELDSHQAANLLTSHLSTITGHAIDERKSIVGIPKIFDKLMEGGEDPLTAVKTVVALLAGEPEA